MLSGLMTIGTLIIGFIGAVTPVYLVVDKIEQREKRKRHAQTR